MFLGCPARRWRGIRDEIERIGAAGVLGERGIVEIRRAGGGIDHDVLHHRAEAFGGGVDLRLGVAREADGLGVAAAFEVEMPEFDQPCSSSPRSWREESFDSVVLPVPERPKKIAEPLRVEGRVGRAMHRHHALAGQDVVQIGEDDFFISPA